MVSEKDVNEFITRRFPIDCNWCDGNCYYFAQILYLKFGGLLYYDTIIGHFVLYKDGNFYDYHGKYVPERVDAMVKWNDFDNYDDLQYLRVVKDCIE